MTTRLILSLLTVVLCAAFTCNAQTQSSATPTEESLHSQCNELLAARGYVASGQVDIWTKTISGVTQTWKLSKITVQASAKAGEPCYGFILLDQYESGDPNPHGSFAEGFVWQESSRTWVPLLPSVLINP